MHSPRQVPVEIRRSRVASSRKAGGEVAFDLTKAVPRSKLFAVKQPQSDLESEVVLVTPEMARLYRDTKHFERQRKIAPANVGRLAYEMKAGSFTPGTQIYICVLPDGSEHIVNGNHTLESVHESGVPQFLTITRNRVKTLDEAGQIYAVFDTQRVRSWADSRKAAGVGEDIPMPDKILSAVKMIERRFSSAYRASTSRTETLGHLSEYEEPARLIADAIAGAPTRTANFVKRAGVLSVALETAKYQPSLAQAFWHNFAMNDGLTNGMPEKALLSCFDGTAFSKAGSSGQSVQAKASALAWNAMFRGESPEMVKPNAMVSFYLLGTPWHKGVGAVAE